MPRASTSQKLQARNAPSRRQAVVHLLRLVAQQQTIAQQLALDRLDCRDIARIIRRDEADHAEMQQAGIKRLGAVGLHETAEFGIESLLANLGMDVICERAPTCGGLGLAVRLGNLDGAVEGHPGHDLRIGEMLALAAHLPYAFIGLHPDFFEKGQNGSRQFASAVMRRKPALAGLQQGVGHLAIDIELHLFGSGIADAYGCRALVATQPGNLPFQQIALTGDAIHDLHLRRGAGDRAQQPVAPALASS